MASPVVVVTGAGRGIGLAVAQALAERGAELALVVRDERRAAPALAPVLAAAAARGSAARVVVGDLGCVRTAKLLARDLTAACPRIDAFVHNAGLLPDRRELEEDGLERAFVVNHLAPFVLNRLLEPVFLASGTHVVQVTAGMYPLGRPDLAKTPRGEDFHVVRTYATTKLMNLLLLPLFTARWQGRGPAMNAVHPGVIRTGLGDRPGALGHLVRAVKWLWKAPEAGARPVVRLALEASPGSGRYFEEETEKELRPMARDPELARRIWAQAEELAGLPREEPDRAA